MAGEARTRRPSRKLPQLPAKDAADGDLTVETYESTRVIPVRGADDEGIDVPHALMVEIREYGRGAGVEPPVPR